MSEQVINRLPPGFIRATDKVKGPRPNWADEEDEMKVQKRKERSSKVSVPVTTTSNEEGCLHSAKFPSFVLCNVFLTYINDDGKATPRRFRWLANKIHTYDPPKDTAHTTAGSGRHQLFGTIQAAAFSLDPASPSFSMFNRNYKDPILVPNLGFLSPHNICYCSIPFSTSVKIAAKLNVTTDPVDDMKDSNAYYDYYRDKVPGEEYNDAFEVCNNLDAALEVAFESTSKETKVVGRVMAYYGKNFDYASSPADYKAMLFETKQHDEVKPGKINLMRSVLPVPAQFSLIIDANLSDSISGDIILSGVYEFFVPADGSISSGVIKGFGCSIKVKVDWKLPPFADETTLAKTSYYADLAKKQVYTGIPKHTPRTMEKDDRWSLQEELLELFHCIVNYNFPEQEEEASMACSSAHFLKSRNFKVLSNFVFHARAMASSSLIVSILATGAKTSSKSMPCCWSPILKSVQSGSSSVCSLI
nr:aminoacyl-tRNA synthetase, class 1a, anticodon-binding [Tanacetum cinerariifolium]